MDHISANPPVPRFFGSRSCCLPNGTEITYQSRSEVAHFYRDIFQKRTYLQNGICLADSSCVFDVGANIGLFTLFVAQECKNARIFSFEPAPPLFAALCANLTRNNVPAKAFNFGLSNVNGAAAFAFYPESSGMSSFYPNLAEEEQALMAVLKGEMRAGEAAIKQLMTFRDEFLEQRFKSQTFHCPLRRLSDVIQENEVDQIDLLKIDVQKSEMDVIEGLDQGDWPRIRQIVLEVHDIEGRVQKLEKLLQQKYFRTHVVQDALYQDSPIFNLYAMRDQEREVGCSFSGAHLLPDEAPRRDRSGASRQLQLLTLSAGSRTALDQSTANLLAWLKDHPGVKLDDVAYTLKVGTEDFQHRRALVCRGVEGAVNLLESCDPRLVLSSQAPGESPKVAFMFPGLGNEYTQMGLELYQSEPVFRDALDSCCEVLDSVMGVRMRELLYPDLKEGTGDLLARGPTSNAAEPQIDLRKMVGRNESAIPTANGLAKTCYSQPALFAVEFALAQLWMSWGIRPQAMMGYSVGEYVAACLSGVLSLKDALLLVAMRAELIEQLPDSALLAVPLSPAELDPLLHLQLSLAAINGPSTCVVAGTRKEVEALENSLRQKSVICRRVRGSRAFHSVHMRPIAGKFGQLFKDVKLQKPRIPYVSNLSGTWITAGEATSPEYWVRHTCEAIRFGDGVKELLKQRISAFIEAGPGQALGSWVLQNAYEGDYSELLLLPSMPHLYDNTADMAVMLGSLARLWLSGANPDWIGFYASQKRSRIELPIYPFDRRSIEPEKTKAEAQSGSPLEQRTCMDHPAPGHEGPFQKITEQARSFHRIQSLNEVSEPQVNRPPHPRPNTSVEYVAPRTDLEARLSRMWQEMLSLQEVGVYDNFFELGGNSLLAAQLVLKLIGAFNSSLSLRTIFEAPTIVDLAVALVQNQAEQADRDEVAKHVAAISQLSPEELRATLAEASRQPSLARKEKAN